MRDFDELSEGEVLRVRLIVSEVGQSQWSREKIQVYFQLKASRSARVNFLHFEFTLEAATTTTRAFLK